MISLKKLSIIPLILLIASCASKKGFEPYSAHGDVQKMPETSYQLSGVELSLLGAKASERYPNEEALQSDLQTYLNEAIEKRGLNGQGYELNVSVQWERKMLGGGDTTKDAFSSAGCRFESKISNNGKDIASDGGDPLNASSAKYNNKNFLNNLKRIGDSITRTGDPESEQRELKRCAKLIVERLPK